MQCDVFDAAILGEFGSLHRIDCVIVKTGADLNRQRDRDRFFDELENLGETVVVFEQT